MGQLAVMRFGILSVSSVLHVCANQPPLPSQNFSKITFQEATTDSETLIAFFIKTIDSPGEQQLAAAQPWKWKDVLLPG